MSLMSLSRGAWEKSGPLGVIGTKAIASAISRPPQAMKGIANETPVSKCCRRFLSISGIEVQCYKRNVVHCSRKPAHRSHRKWGPVVFTSHPGFSSKQQLQAFRCRLRETRKCTSVGVSHEDCISDAECLATNMDV